MRVLSISTDWNVFNEDSAVARRQRMQASTVERLDVFVPHGPRQIINLAGNATMRGFGRGQFRGALRMLASAYRLPRPDIVTAQDPFLIGFLAYMMARMRGARIHFQIHTDLFDPHFLSLSVRNRLHVAIARLLLPRADGIRVVSKRLQESLAKRGITRNVSVLPVFVDIEAIKSATPVDLRREYPQFNKIVLVAARLEPEKNVGAAIDAFAEIRKVQKSAGLIILGDGAERKILEEKVRALGLADSVVFAGTYNPLGYFKSADVLLSTSHYEGYGMVMVEALAAGCPVVSYDVGVAKEAGAIIATDARLAQVAIAVLSEGKRGILALSLPSAIEYRDMWRSEIAGSVAPERKAKPPASSRPTIGYVGQGWIGRNYADDFERRGFEVVRYALEEPYRQNKDRIKECDIVFIAVPTPTTPKGYDDSIVRSAVSLVGKGKTAIIKSTMLPGMTEDIQKSFPHVAVMHSPEFLREATAAYDASHPDRNIVGITEDSPEMREKAKSVLSVLPAAPFELVCSSLEAELIKYAGNGWLFVKVVFVNLLYDLAEKLGAQYDIVRDALAADPRIGRSHLDPIHQSGHGGTPGRGAGGHCFIKDFAAFRAEYESSLPTDVRGIALLKALESKNIDLLIQSGKDIELLRGVYGAEIDQGGNPKR